MSGHYVGEKCECQFEFPGLSDISKLRVMLRRPGSNNEELLEVTKGSGQSVLVSFSPDNPGEHQLSMLVSGRHVSGSPFQIPVEEKPASSATGNPMSLALELSGVNLPSDFEHLTAKLQRPGENIPKDDLKLDLLPDNTVSLTFVPLVSGEHLVYIYKKGREVSGSPFAVRAEGPTPPDPSKVKVIGDGCRRGISGQLSKFTIDAREAGDGGLGFSVEGPSKAELNCISKEDGTCQVEFLPKAPGVYTIHIKYADQHIPGSPFICAVASEDGKIPDEIPPPRVRTAPADITRREFIVESSLPAPSSITPPRHNPPPAQRPHGLEVDLTGYDISKLSANVETPTGKVEDAEIVQTTRDKYTVTFITRNGGTHKVNVLYNRKHIPGSPFLVDVDTANWQLTSKAKVTGPKEMTGAIGVPCEYLLSTKDSGGGKLGVSVEGPVPTEIHCEASGNDEYKIYFTPTTSGSYVVYMRFNDQDVFKSLVYVPEIQRSPGEPTELSNTSVKVGEKFTLEVPYTGTADELTSHVITPSGTKIPAKVTKIDNSTYGITFIPEQPGEYIIHILLKGVPLSGSPYKLKVGEHAVDPSKIRVYGPGLKGATAGQETSFTVDAKEAGPGTLSIDAEGPAKLDVRCELQTEGSYLVSYTPVVSGDYKINIGFGGTDVPNSPFKIKVVPDPNGANAQLCTSRGSGLYGGVQGRPSPFTVNCSKAGRGSLLVGVEGPTIPVNEINIKHDGNNIFLVDYSLEEPGDYILKVLWGDEHIQGSPFPVRVETADGIHVGR